VKSAATMPSFAHASWRPVRPEMMMIASCMIGTLDLKRNVSVFSCFTTFPDSSTTTLPREAVQPLLNTDPTSACGSTPTMPTFGAGDACAAAAFRRINEMSTLPA